ncbi:hypothetical protein [Bizionia myxarmorum]|uniref:Uncharacterized protein n=1 Tax=Bizionia myxarmorum TaxID=291186 RepID=A0A5D0RCP6_9FLAO|nr:hypothetical protein [Bizionia myxarmorum]TYB79163.1 hypothetical protein ES674_05150 [Bizionia myxarmorum]
MIRKNYKEAFAVDEKSYAERKLDDNYTPHPFQLNNYSYYEPKLIPDFYIKYFTRELLFDLHILDAKDFLQYHYDYCDNPELYFSVLELEIVPKINEIIENAEVCLEASGDYYKEIKLEDGFVETEGVIKNSQYEYSLMFHMAGLDKLQNNLIKRSELISSFLTAYIDNRAVKPLKWIGRPSQLAIIVRELIDQGYMEADKRNGEINCASLSRDLMQAFTIAESDSPKTIEIYLSNGSKRYTNAKTIFDGAGFSLPPADFT